MSEHEEKAIDETVPTGRWSFDEGVTAVFEDMLRRSIPQYETMRRAVVDVGSQFIQRNTAIVDIGCSRGEAVAPFVDRFGAGNSFVLLDVSKPMLDVARERYAGWIKAGVVRVLELDVRKEYPPVLASLTLSVLTLQFTPLEHRAKILRRIFESTAPGGAFVLVEKVLLPDAHLEELFVQAYHALKRENGYSDEAIARKALSLEGVLVPVTPDWNEELLRRAGFSRVAMFWRWFNFAGWVAVK